MGYGYDYDDGDVRYFHRPHDGNKFEVLFEYNAFEDKPVSILGFGLDPDILYYLAMTVTTARCIKWISKPK